MQAESDLKTAEGKVAVLQRRLQALRGNTEQTDKATESSVDAAQETTGKTLDIPKGTKKGEKKKSSAKPKKI